MRNVSKATTWWLAAALAVTAFVGYAGWAYWQADSSTSLAFSRARDQVLADGRQEIADLNTIDEHNVDAGLRRWLDASTGLLHDELQQSQSQSKRKILKAGSSARGTVTDAAVTELDTRGGTARLIASVTVDVTPRSGAAASDRQRFEAGLGRTSQGWKLTSLTAIPVGAG